jgi:hypothetical protein
MRKDTLTKVTASLKDKYPELGLERIDVNDSDGTASFYLQPTNKSLAFLDGKGKISGIIPRLSRETAATVTRDSINRTTLDLALQRDAYDMAPRDAYERAIRLYYTEPIVGSTINILANIARKGFENDIDDENIKNFFDVWAFDANFEDMLEWVFLDLFKVGQVYTYKVISKYEPRVSYLSPVPGQKIKNGGTNKAKGVQKEDAAAKKIWSKGHLPIAYTVLNPLLVEVEGSLLFDKYSISMTLPPELGQLLKKDQKDLSEEEKELVKALPSELKRAATAGGTFKLDSRLVGTISYRKQPYERYAKPRLAKVFDSLEYKKALKQADLSTLDGITNYILKVTIGSDEFPVTTQSELEAVAALFNTPSKSFDVVWNHTLNIEKIVSPEIESILGQDKYKQVNEDISGGLGMARALLDGTGEMSTSESNLFIKGLEEEVAYARRLVTKWIYKEYRLIAEAMGFDRFPKIRWDESVLKDQILYMNILAQLVDRRMLSYSTAHELLGFDYRTELNNMEQEFDLVKKGTIGIIGSPWQQAKGLTQPGQNAPKGTPSAGRPAGAPAKPRDKTTQPQNKPGQKPKNPPKKTASSITLRDAVKNMDKEEFKSLMGELYELRLSEEEEE